MAFYNSCPINKIHNVSQHNARSWKLKGRRTCSKRCWDIPNRFECKKICISGKGHGPLHVNICNKSAPTHQPLHFQTPTKKIGTMGWDCWKTVLPFKTQNNAYMQVLWGSPSLITQLAHNLIGDSLIGVIHKKPKEGGISAVGGTGSIYTFYGPEEPLFKSLTENFLQKDLPHVMPALDLAAEPIPLWWTTDFINASPPGTKAEDEKWIVGEFNCSCVGISRCLAAYCKDDTPNASWDDISEEDKAEAKKMGDLMGEKALKILSKWSPSKPTCLINCTMH